MWCYAALALCLSVAQVCVLARFWHRGFLLPILHCFTEIWLSPQIRIVPLGIWCFGFSCNCYAVSVHGCLDDIKNVRDSYLVKNFDVRA